MAKLAWTPWHKVVQLREDVKSGELSLAIFAADCSVCCRRYGVLFGKPSQVVRGRMGAASLWRNHGVVDYDVATRNGYPDQ